MTDVAMVSADLQRVYSMYMLLNVNTEKTAKNEKWIFLERNSISANHMIRDSHVKFGFITNSEERKQTMHFMASL